MPEGDVILSEPELQNLCLLWQKRLRLQDWDVRVKVSRAHEMGMDGKRACVCAQLLTKEALVEVLDPTDYKPQVWPNDNEQSLVHELLHLHFAPFEADEKTPEGVAQEQAIELIACALVSLARGVR